MGVVVPGVIGRRVLCFRFPHAEFAFPTNFRWKPSTSVTPPIAGQGSVTPFWTLNEHGHNVYISTTFLETRLFPRNETVSEP